MKSKLGQYIGITGFTQRPQVEALLPMIPENRLMMCGLLVSGKSIRGTKSGAKAKRYPQRALIDAVFVDHPRIVNLIHYAQGREGSAIDFDVMNQVKHLHGYQLNMVWPDPDYIEKHIPNGMRIVLQIGKTAYEKCSRNPLAVAKRVVEYTTVTDVLFDQSGGNGEALNKFESADVLQAIYEAAPYLGLGVAGGLDHNNTVHRLRPLFKDFSFLSIDAESGLRDENDELNLAKCKLYLQQAHEVMPLQQLSNFMIYDRDMGL